MTCKEKRIQNAFIRTIWLKSLYFLTVGLCRKQYFPLGCLWDLVSLKTKRLIKDISVRCIAHLQLVQSWDTHISLQRHQKCDGFRSTKQDMIEQLKNGETGIMTCQTLPEIFLACFSSLLNCNIFPKSSCLFSDLPNLSLSFYNIIWCNTIFYICSLNNLNGIWFLLSREFGIEAC